jgi:hypothetical protein
VAENLNFERELKEKEEEMKEAEAEREKAKEKERLMQLHGKPLTAPAHGRLKSEQTGTARAFRRRLQRWEPISREMALPSHTTDQVARHFCTAVIDSEPGELHESLPIFRVENSTGVAHIAACDMKQRPFAVAPAKLGLARRGSLSN